MKRSQKPKIKKKNKTARLERRVRVTFFLVSEIQEEVDAVQKVILYLSHQYWYYISSGKWELPVTGFTHSAVPRVVFKKDPTELEFDARRKDSIFVGFWWPETETEIIYIGDIDILVPVEEPAEENVTLFVIDFPIIAEEWKLDQNIAHLKEKIFSIYKEHKRPQEEIWIVKQDIYRYA